MEVDRRDVACYVSTRQRIARVEISRSIPTTPVPRGFFRRYIFTSDHKTIGRQYFFLSLAAVLAGAWLSLLMRVHLVWPRLALPFLGEIKPENYLGYLTMHGTLMVFFVLSTVPQNGFGAFFLPLEIGSSEMAFSRLNTAGFLAHLISFLLLFAAFLAPAGPSCG